MDSDIFHAGIIPRWALKESCVPCGALALTHSLERELVSFCASFVQFKAHPSIFYFSLQCGFHLSERNCVVFDPVYPCFVSYLGTLINLHDLNCVILKSDGFSPFSKCFLFDFFVCRKMQKLVTVCISGCFCLFYVNI